LVRRPLFGLLYQPRMGFEYREVGGMRIGRGNQSTRRKPAPVPLCPPQIPHDLTWCFSHCALLTLTGVIGRLLAPAEGEGRNQRHYHGRHPGVPVFTAHRHKPQCLPAVLPCTPGDSRRNCSFHFRSPEAERRVGSKVQTSNC
jgi:hypothetical protein